MKQILTTIVIFLLSVVSAHASEITGKISTDPKALNVQTEPGSGTSGDNEGSDVKADDAKSKIVSSSGSRLMARKKIIAIATTSVDVKKPETTDKPADKQAVKVLGVRFFPDGSLLRTEDKRIYLIKGGYKKYIASLKELSEFRGQEIISVSQDDLDQYKFQPYGNGELIREIGDGKIYVVEIGKIRLVKNLEELRDNYSGKVVNNITHEEMEAYK